MLLTKQDKAHPPAQRKTAHRAPAFQLWSKTALSKSHEFQYATPQALYTAEVAKMPRHETTVLKTGKAMN